MRRSRIAATEEQANDAAAVARIASGVGRCGLNFANTAVRTNMCMRYIPYDASETGRTTYW